MIALVRDDNVIAGLPTVARDLALRSIGSKQAGLGSGGEQTMQRPSAGNFLQRHAGLHQPSAAISGMSPMGRRSG